MAEGTRTGPELFERWIMNRKDPEPDGSQEVLLECGHWVICIIPPTYLVRMPCGQCLGAYVEANRG